MAIVVAGREGPQGSQVARRSGDGQYRTECDWKMSSRPYIMPCRHDIPRSVSAGYPVMAAAGTLSRVIG